MRSPAALGRHCSICRALRLRPGLLFEPALWRQIVVGFARRWHFNPADGEGIELVTEPTLLVMGANGMLGHGAALVCLARHASRGGHCPQ